MPDAKTSATTDGHDGLRGLDRLLRLQDLDLQLARLTARLEQIEGGADVRTTRERRSVAETALGELKLSIDDVAREQRKLEGDVESIDHKRRDEEHRLYDGTVANPKELQAIRAEVESLAARKGRMEDALLEVMERLEELEAQRPSLEQAAAEARADVDRVLASDADELERIERDIGHLSRDREAVVPGIDPGLLRLYEDLRKQKRGVGAAALKDGVCQGCHQKLSPMEIDRMKRAGGVWRCENCRRILVPA